MYENVNVIIEDADNRPRDQRAPLYLEAIAKSLFNLVELQSKKQRKEVKNEAK